VFICPISILALATMDFASAKYIPNIFIIIKLAQKSFILGNNKFIHFFKIDFISNFHIIDFCNIIPYSSQIFYPFDWICLCKKSSTVFFEYPRHTMRMNHYNFIERYGFKCFNFQSSPLIYRINSHISLSVKVRRTIYIS